MPDTTDQEATLTRDEGIHFLTHDDLTDRYSGHDRVLCSRWGHDGYQCAQVAWDLDQIISDATGEGPNRRTLDHAMRMVVNDHDDVAYMFREHGGQEIRDKYADELKDA